MTVCLHDRLSVHARAMMIPATTLNLDNSSIPDLLVDLVGWIPCRTRGLQGRHAEYALHKLRICYIDTGLSRTLSYEHDSHGVTAVVSETTGQKT